MYRLYLTVLIILSQVFTMLNAQNVGIGTLTPENSAILDLNSNSSGLLIPRMTIGERNNISNPATGLLIYNLDANAFEYFTGKIWSTLNSDFIAPNSISDNDHDTGIYTDKSELDEDIINFEVEGFPLAQFEQNRLELKSQGNSIYIGDEAGAVDKSQLNIGLGAHALNKSSLGGFNVAIGHNVGANIKDGSNNVLIGHLSGSSYNGFNNTFIGFQSGLNNSGSSNTFLGYDAGRDNQGQRNVFIGSEAGSLEQGSDKLYIANSATSNPLIHGDFIQRKVTINNDLQVNGQLQVEEINVENITGLLGSGQTAEFPEVIYNTTLVEIDGLLNEEVFIVNSLGWEIDTFSMLVGDINVPELGFNMEFPLIFETDKSSVIQAMDTWIESPSPRNVTVNVTTLSGTVAYTWQLFEYNIESKGIGSDGRTRYTISHIMGPDNVVASQCDATFGNELSFDPVNDQLVSIEGITGESFAPATSIDLASKTIVLEYNINEGSGIRTWIENLSQGIKDRRLVTVSKTIDGTPSGVTSTRLFYEAIGFKYEHISGFGLDTKIRARVHLTYATTVLLK